MCVFGLKFFYLKIERILFQRRILKMQLFDQYTTLGKLANKKRMVGCFIEI
jgi:hypothetical protein